MKGDSFQGIKIVFERYGLFSLWRIKLVKNAVIYCFGSLNDVLEHGRNFFLFNALLYVALFIG
jgi:hypothetical protein